MNNFDKMVAIIGAGVAGSEAALQFVSRGIPVAIFEQNALPYGKIEEGLPKWHIKLRNQEEAKIDKKLHHPHVYYIPNVTLGKDFQLKEIVNWGFSGIVLAIGAWKDRSLPIDDIDDFVGKGLYYQNSLVSWFNHKHEPDYKDPHFYIPDQAIVVGGGLASLDVVKIILLETTRKALEKSNHFIDIFTLEREGINQVLKGLGLTLAELGLSGCSLYYRKRIADMPLAPMPSKPDENRRQKVFLLRQRILSNYQKKFPFNVREGYLPRDKIVENGRLTGLVFKRTDSESDVSKKSDEEFTIVKSPLVVSSIGSVAQPLPQLPVRGELLQIEDSECGKLTGYSNVFAVGNVVTGRGNIRESQLDGRKISKKIIEDYFFDHEYESMIRERESDTAKGVEEISRKLNSQGSISATEVRSLMSRVKQLQEKTGYDGNYLKWISRHCPLRLEELLNISFD